jgi:acyl-CoA thioesterase
VTDGAVPAELVRRITDDPWARSLGVEYLDVRPGYCRAALRLAPHMVNHLGSPHGSVVFALADAAFGVACNSHGAPAVALNVTIGFLAAARPGSRLTAECRERRQGRQAGFYEVTVTDDDGTLIAVLHCIAHRLARGGRRPPTAR